MLEGRRVGALLLMGGVGERFGSAVPKQFHRLSGKPVYRVTLEAFLAAGFFDEIVLSCHPDWMGRVEAEMAATPVRVVRGGDTRQASSRLGLLAFGEPPLIVLIHDAVRPFVSKAILYENARLAMEYGAVDTCIRSADTIVYAPEGKMVAGIPPRAHYLRGQTPQSFSFPLIVRAHETTRQTNASDDCVLVSEMGHPIAIAEGDEQNLKITSELDLFVAEQLFRLRVAGAPTVAPEALTGKRFAVVGGTGGIGAALCGLLQGAGAEAVTLSRSGSIPLDLREPASIERAFAQLGPIDGLINAAGLLVTGPLCQSTSEVIREVLEVNLHGLILCCKAARVREGGHILNLASSAFSRGRPGAGVYSCSKAAVVNFTQALAEERPDLFVHVVVPQRTRTPMRERAFPGEDPATLLDPMEVARVLFALLGDRSSTGGLIEVKK